MDLHSFTVENYRAFGRRTEVELRPLTLLFGHNSSGKSALVRVLPLLAESVREAGAPLHLSGRVGRGAGWRDLICKGREKASTTVSLGLTFEEPPSGQVSVRLDILGDLENRYQYVDEMTLSRGRGGGIAPYMNEVQVFGEPGPSAPPDFNGPLPASPDSRFSGLFDAMAGLPRAVQWISGLRERPGRDFLLSGSPPRHLEPDGNNAADILVRGERGALFEEVGQYFEELGETLYTAPLAAGRYALELARVTSPHVRVNILDTGEGHAQVLPVLVALARARLGGPPVVTVEQPELHLHTRAQLALANQLTRTVTMRPESRLLVETHSEVLLTAVQLAVAEERLRPDQVRIYWVQAEPDGQTTIVPVELDTLGRPTSPTLIGIFEEPARLGRKLLKARRERSP